MNRISIRRLMVASLASVLSLSCVSSVLADPIPVESIAKHPAISGLTLSPDGEHIAGFVAVEGQKWPVLSIWKTSDLSAKPVWIPTEEMRYRFVNFLGNDKILFIADQPITRRQKNDFTYKLYTADLDGKNIKEPLKKQGTLNDAVRRAESRGVTIGIFTEDLNNEDFVLLSKVNVSNGSEEIYRLNVKTNRIKKIGSTGEDWSYIASLVNPETGELLGKRELVNEDGDFWSKVYIRQNEDAGWVYHPVLSSRLKDLDSVSIIGFDGSLNKLMVTTDRGQELAKAYSYDVGTQSLSRTPAFENPDYNILNVVMGRKDKSQKFSKPIGVVVEGPSVKVIFTDSKWKTIQDNLERQFPGMDISISNRRNDKNMALITISDERTPPSHLLYVNGKLEPLGNERPWMNPKDSGKSKWVTFKARDGLEVPAILTLPPGYKRSQGRIPTIVHPHGGPWARDYMGWDQSGWTQFLTSRGAAVIQPQYRGSSGLGRKLFVAGHKEWGQKMQDDKDDAAAWLVRQGIADSNKLAIFGYSYGGFAAIAASVRPNSPYQCAISGAGVSSLDRIGNLWGSGRIGLERQAWTVKGMDPIKNVDKANIPILLYHGDGDRQADTEHSRIFYKAMKSAKKDVEYIEIDTMWHQLPWWPEWHRISLTAIERYLKSSKCNVL